MEMKFVCVCVCVCVVCLAAARNHVNRMCLAADVPLVESGTAGYLGQVTVIKKVVPAHVIYSVKFAAIGFS